MVATKPTWPSRLAGVIRSRPVVTALAGAVAGMVILVALVLLSRPDGKLHVWWLDAGHSNAVLIQTPSGADIGMTLIRRLLRKSSRSYMLPIRIRQRSMHYQNSRRDIEAGRAADAKLVERPGGKLCSSSAICVFALDG